MKIRNGTQSSTMRHSAPLLSVGSTVTLACLLMSSTVLSVSKAVVCSLLPSLRLASIVRYVVVNQHVADIAVGDLRHEIGIRDGGRVVAAHLEALHHGDEHHGDHDPEQKILDHLVHRFDSHAARCRKNFQYNHPWCLVPASTSMSSRSSARTALQRSSRHFPTRPVAKRINLGAARSRRLRFPNADALIARAQVFKVFVEIPSLEQFDQERTTGLQVDGGKFRCQFSKMHGARLVGHAHSADIGRHIAEAQGRQRRRPAPYPIV